MTNVVLQPGDDTLESLIAGVDDGIYIATDVMTDIDDNRELCSFGGEIGWRIRSGELAEPIVRPYLYTDTHEILGSCDGIGSEAESVVTGILGCGKGQPWQFIFTGQGGPPARFRNIAVGPPGS
jgi:TldD protein